MAKRKSPRGFAKGKWTESSIKVLRERYLAKDGLGREVETPEGMFYRVASRVAGIETNFGRSNKEIEQLTKDYYDLMVSRFFMPNSPTLMNAGKIDGLQYSACFVLPIEDSIEAIFETIKNAALIHKSGGGTGFSFSRLRPKGSIVRSTSGVASGPVSFMRVFDSATNEIKQGGTRRGANMGVLRVDHPDILEFIESKAEGGITNFNISVAMTDEFVKAVKKNGRYGLIEPHGKKKVKKLRARQVFEKIVGQAWKTGDPGVIFIDRVNKGQANPVPFQGPIEATNPCGEQPLYPNEACNLGSLNLPRFLNRKKNDLDWRLLKKKIHLSVRFLDDVIEANPFPLKQIDRMVKLNRRVGLGVMGWADLLFELKIPYASTKALKLAEKTIKFIQKEAHLASQGLARERGAFPNFKKSIYKNGKPLRNATLTTIAPSGSISVITGCSSGIEPIFALCFKHRTEDRELTFVNPYFKKIAQKLHLSANVWEKVEAQGNLEGIEEIPKKIRKIFVTAHEVAWPDHIAMQAVFQKGTDNAVSKTINLPHQATRKDVYQAYLRAYETGCMGVTVFRDGCKQEQVLYSGLKKKKGTELAKNDTARLKVKSRPKVVSGKTYRIATPVGTAFVTVNTNGNNEPLEVFVNVGKAGSAIMADAEAIGRLISLSLKVASPYPNKEVLWQVIDQLNGISGGDSVGFGKDRILSLADGIAHVLSEYYQGEEQEFSKPKGEVSPVVQQPSLLSQNKRRDLCPDCGRASLIFQEGCAKCLYCGYNKC